MVLHPLFTEQHEELRRSTGAFVESELAPHSEDWEREGYFPDWVFKRMGTSGSSACGIRRSTEGRAGTGATPS